MLRFLRKCIPERSPLRLTYHKVSAMLAALWYRRPASELQVIGVTGTSGKSSTVELIHHLLQSSGIKAGALSSVQFWFGDQREPNVSLRTTLRCWTTQKYLRRMVKLGCKAAVIEVSSHALDQHRTWGIPIDTAVLTNITEDEHMDYHGTLADYVATKLKLFTGDPPPTNIVLNQEDPQFEIFHDAQAEKKLTFGHTSKADVHASAVKLEAGKSYFQLHFGKNKASIEVPLVGLHNIENALAASAVASCHGVKIDQIAKAFAIFPGIPGRLEPIEEGQGFPVLVDHTYKPSALRAVLTALKEVTPGKVRVVWGGCGGRLKSFWEEAGAVLDELADEIILTTDDPYNEDPKAIAQAAKDHIKRSEGKGFFEIEDRYEAIRYALFVAEPGDTVLVAGRGIEQVQTIGHQKIKFDDRTVCREILRSVDFKKPAASPPPASSSQAPSDLTAGS